LRAFFAGIDVGSLSAEAVIVDADGRMLGYSVRPTGHDGRRAGSEALAEALERAGLERGTIASVVATGYSRKRIAEAGGDKTEISCHAKGIACLLPQARTIIDIGGQDSKAIRIAEGGRVLDFAMNDKCAAGTGRFLEVMASALGIGLGEFGEIALGHQAELVLSTTCTVFAESEVVSLISQGHAVADIAYALAKAIATRTVGLAKRVGVEPPVAMSGGVAKNLAVVQALEEALGCKIQVPPEPQIVGALGAALFARDRGRNANL